jgi:hypothetical protein
LDAPGERLPEIRNKLRATPDIANIFLRLRYFLEQAAGVAPAYNVSVEASIVTRL